MSDVATTSPAPRVFSAVLGSPALRLIVKRLLTAIPILLGVSILMFVLLNLIPGSAALQLLGPEATPEQIARLEHDMGLDRPPVERYLEWLWNALQGDLGRSLVSRQPVTDVLPTRLAVTGELVALAFLISLTVAIPLALLAARRPNRFLDRVSMVVSTAGLSVANYVLALLLVLLFAVKLGWFPAIGYTPVSKGLGDNLYSLALPAFAMAFPLLCFYTRFLRGDLVDQMQGEDYVMTARAKGLGPWQVLLRHAFRNSSFGLITIVGLNISGLIGATVIIESIFSLPGIGQYLLQGILTRDYIVVQAIVIIFAIITVLANLMADVLYAVLDPRIRYGTN
ncbi:MAG TPA: ABC transporter permease [Micromonosporaceae bacterium]|nr:ABC transporter permease [Micromonosporaceae bacterium]